MHLLHAMSQQWGHRNSALPTRTNKHNTQQTSPNSTESSPSRRTQQTKTKNVISRRYAQRRKQQTLKKKKTQHYKITNQKLYHTKQRCIHHYGFVANPKTNLQQNFNNTIKNTTRYETKHLINSTYHNLCTINKIPLGTKKLLGLNLKFCLSTNKIPNNIPSTIRHMAYNIRTHYYLKECSANNDTEYIKQIYVKNRNWNPPPAPINIENKITEFERALQAALSSKISKNKKVNFKNLLLPQQHRP